MISLAEIESWQKEHFSLAYLHAVVTRSGYSVTRWCPDKDGVDATIRWKGLMVDLQLKCTQNPRRVSEDYAFDLDIPTYDKLRDPERSAPGYLVMMIVPGSLDRWIDHKPEHLVLSCHAYWAMVQDAQPAKGDRTTAVRLPRDQRLTQDALKHMFETSLNRLRFGRDTGEAK